MYTFFSFGDIKTIEWSINQKTDPQEQLIAKQQLRQVIDYAEGTDCRRKIQLRYFGEQFAGNCANCDNCLYSKPIQDWTVEAMKFLSCVARCKERFGMTHIIDVLRGAKTQKIALNQHNLLSTYGIGKDKTVDEWRMLGRSLLHQGLLEQTTDGYSVLKLNALSWQVMRRQRTVAIAAPIMPKVMGAEVSAKSAVDADEVLMQRLRSLRKQLADEQSVAPYIIFPDSTLKIMAQVLPKTLEDFAQIYGVGDHKLSQYGEKFLAEIQAYRELKHLNELSGTELTTLQMYQQGLSVNEIASKRHVRPTTIIGHLADLIEKNQPVDLNKLVSPERQQKIWQVLEALGDINLTPIPGVSR